MPSSSRAKPDRHATDVVGARIGAQIIDLIAMFVQVMALTVGIAVLVRPESESAIRGFVGFSLLTLPFYGGLLEGLWNGQTLGKRVFGIKVVNRRGTEASLGQALARNVPAVILFSWVTSAVALASMAITDRRQRVFDAIAGTYVVRA